MKSALKLNEPEALHEEVGDATHCMKETLPVSMSGEVGHEVCAVV